MANAKVQKKGLTTFGWLALGGLAAAVLSSKDRRDKLMNAARDLADKITPSSSTAGAEAGAAGTP